MYRRYSLGFHKVEAISAEDSLAAFNEKRAIFVDCRGAAERDVSTIPGSVSGDAFQSAVDKIKGSKCPITTHLLLQTLRDSDEAPALDASHVPREEVDVVICYCTVGAR